MQFSPPPQDFKTWSKKNQPKQPTKQKTPKPDVHSVVISPNLWTLLYLFSKPQTFLFVAHPTSSSILHLQHRLPIDSGSWCYFCCSGARSVSFPSHISVTHNSAGLFGIHKGYITKAASTGAAQTQKKVMKKKKKKKKSPLFHVRSDKKRWIQTEVEIPCKITVIAVYQLPYCHTGRVSRGVWRREKMRALQVSTGAWSSKGSWWITGILLLVEQFCISSGGGRGHFPGWLRDFGAWRMPQQPSSRKLLPSHVLTDHGLVEASGFLLLEVLLSLC